MENREFEVVIRLVSNSRPCHNGHQVGDEWVFNYNTPAGLCSLAYNAIYPAILTLRYGGRFPWQEDPDVILLACPDSEVHNVFELRRRIKQPLAPR
jgi:uncharacterized repeat protein (TIGR04076 family)